MSWKSVLVIVVTYLVIFGAIAVYFTYKGNRGGTGDQSTWTALKEGFFDIGRSIGAFFKSFRVKSPVTLNLTLNLFPRCSFPEGFTCLSHNEDKAGKEILLNIKSLLIEPIIFYETRISGGIVCNKTEQHRITPNEEFYVKLENCQFNSAEGKIRLIFYKEGSSIMFNRSIEGVLVAK